MARVSVWTPATCGRSRRGTRRTHGPWARRRRRGGGRHTATAAAPTPRTTTTTQTATMEGCYSGVVRRTKATSCVEPAVVLEQHVQVEQVVGGERRAGAVLGELGGPAATARAGRRPTRAGRRSAGSPSRCTVWSQPGHRNRYAPGIVVVAAHPDGEVVDLELHVPARRALGSDGRHDGPTSQETRGPLASSHRHAGAEHLRTAPAECDVGNNRCVAAPITFAHRGASADGPRTRCRPSGGRSSSGPGASSPTPA